MNKQYQLLKSLLSDQPEIIDSIDADGRTPLHWAASSGATDIVRYLLDRKADVDKLDSSGWTALHIAGTLILASYFLNDYLTTILVSAGHEEIVRELVGAGADVQRINDKGLTPLHYAASKSRIEIGRFLISRGADVNAKDKANQHPLHRAATTGSVGFIKLLLESAKPPAKVRLNTADRIGNTPLHLAMESGHAEAAVLLINAGADRDRTNQDGLTPEQVDGVGEIEQRQVRRYVAEHCGQP
ncbi:hypothetical protein PC9H_009998 [Pleurotus ostreatus]|uniref:26S proteasome non-ATPase regulatory subunit 10 n=1 Tax=Pleurotus ostreatus TaxID=5322 RepID=A0A8H6ZQS3_PLEOS|nr:uncharacterized protein PC9H_009998 [Pleurotus ostreatus]KAF7424687.1 hypothetical protein PC9H_009998 [Pleurotus ostreatus]